MMRQRAARTRLPITLVLVAALGLASALCVSIVAHPNPAFAAGCTIVPHPTAAHHTACPRANLENHDYSGVDLSYADFSDAILISAAFRDANLSHADLSYAKGYGINLSGAILYHADLRRANISNPQRGLLCHTIGVPLSGADRECVLFETTVVNGCTIVHDPTETHHTNCPDAYLGHKKLPGPRVNLSWANLPGANLVEANLVGTQLVHAVLSRANLTLANLAGANLTGGNLSGIYDLTYVKWNNTICSDGTNSSSHGGTCEGHLSPAP